MTVDSRFKYYDTSLLYHQEAAGLRTFEPQTQKAAQRRGLLAAVYGVVLLKMYWSMTM